MNAFLKENGFFKSGRGEIKGCPEDYLEQSSILADTQEVRFVEGVFEVSTCYYEFAQRYKLPSGDLFRVL